jgi:hypothetical protein
VHHHGMGKADVGEGCARPSEAERYEVIGGVGSQRCEEAGSPGLDFGEGLVTRFPEAK